MESARTTIVLTTSSLLQRTASEGFSSIFVFYRAAGGFEGTIATIFALFKNNIRASEELSLGKTSFWSSHNDFVSFDDAARTGTFVSLWTASGFAADSSREGTAGWVSSEGRGAASLMAVAVSLGTRTG